MPETWRRVTMRLARSFAKNAPTAFVRYWTRRSAVYGKPRLAALDSGILMSKLDTRTIRTERRLRASLGSLIQEKDYESIVVKEILARAEVARSTFYTHFDDKEALLLSCVEQVLADVRAQTPGAGDPIDRLLSFSFPLLRHIQARRGRAPTDPVASSQQPVHRRLKRVLASLLEADLRRLRDNPNAPALPPELLAGFLVTVFLQVTAWWMQRMPTLKPEEVYAIYRRLAEPSLRG